MESGQLAILVDFFAKVREKRLKADKHAKALKTQENEVEAEIIEELQKAGLSKVGGKIASVTLQEQHKPIVRDWPALYDYIRDNDAFDLLHRRLTEAAVKERVEDGVNVPGLGTFVVPKLSVSKV